MELVNQNGRRMKLILGKKDSEIHYHEIPVPTKTEEASEE